MTNVVVTVEYANHQRLDLALPLNVPCRQLAVALGKALNIEGDLEKSFILNVADTAVIKIIPSNSTLYDAGILNGHILRLTTENSKEARAIPQGGAMLQSGQGQSFSLTSAYVLLGRSDPCHNILPDVDLAVLDPQKIISRRHACIEFDQIMYTITDLGSANGTWINSRRLDIKSPEPIKDGDEIILGRNGVKLIFKRS